MKNIKIIVPFLFLLVFMPAACADRDGNDLSLVGNEVRTEVTAEENAGISAASDTADTASVPDIPAESAVIVYVCGCVERPGVYELPYGSRVCDALEAAGGFGEGADEKRINLAGMISDGEMIFFPEEGEEIPDEASDHLQKPAEESPGGLVNINTAGEDKLVTLPGIGSSKARAIIMYREEHGGFNDIKEIMNVSGIGENLFKQIEGLICV